MKVDITQLLMFATSMIWPLGRVTGFLLTAPLLSTSFIPVSIKLWLIILLTVILACLHPAPVELPSVSSQYALFATKETVIGSILGFSFRLVFESLTMVGQLVSSSMGLNFEEILSPLHETSAPMSTINHFYIIFIMLTFLAIDGHLILISFLSESLYIFPAKILNINPDIFWNVTASGAQLFSNAFFLALPIIIALLITNIYLVIMVRLTPAFNLLTTGFLITASIGFLMVWITLRFLSRFIIFYIENSLTLTQQLLKTAL